MFSNDYVSEFRLNFEPERGRVVHLVVGIHVADVAVVPDQVHVTKFLNSTNVAITTWRHVCQFKISFKSELIFTIIISISLKMTSDCL